MDTPTISLVCPVCKACHELHPTAYTERTCTGCGCGLVLRGGKLEGSIYFYPYFITRCAHCRHVFDPRETKPWWALAVDCPRCARELGRVALKPENFERES